MRVQVKTKFMSHFQNTDYLDQVSLYFDKEQFEALGNPSDEEIVAIVRNDIPQVYMNFNSMLNHLGFKLESITSHTEAIWSIDTDNEIALAFINGQKSDTYKSHELEDWPLGEHLFEKCNDLTEALYIPEFMVYLNPSAENYDDAFLLVKEATDKMLSQA